MAQGDKDGSVSEHHHLQPLSDLNKVLDLVSLPEVPRKLPRS
jgi:hypothetical protein